MNIYLQTDEGLKLFKDVSIEELNKRNIRIGEGASIGEWARIETQTQCCVITNLGSRNASMTAYLHKDSIMIGTRYFLDTIEVFEKAVKEKHKGTHHEVSYLAALDYVRKVLK